MALELSFTILLLLPFILYFLYLFRSYLPSFVHESNTFKRVILPFATHLDWALNFILCYCVIAKYNYIPNMRAARDIGSVPRRRQRGQEWRRAAPTDADDCPICLNRVEAGQQIGEMICSHVFHRPCLELWLDSYIFNCPLCQGPLGQARSDSVVGEEVFVFDFCSFSSRGSHRDNISQVTV